MNVKSFFTKRWFSDRVSRFRGLPLWCTFEITTRCNLMCANCRPLILKSDSNFGKGKDMTMEDFDTLFDKLPFIRRFEFAGFGEPFLHPRFFEMVAKANRSGKTTVAATNGTLLGEEACVKVIESGLSILCISVDGAKPETFEKLRAGANFEEVTANIRTLVETKRRMKSETPRLIINVVASRDNEGELVEIIHLARSLGVPEVSIKNLYAPFPDLRARQVLTADRPRLAEQLMQSARRLQIRLRTPMAPGDGCQKLIRAICITVEGYVSPCFFAYYPGKVQFGNLFEDKFTTIWNNPQYRQLRTTKVIRADAKIPECCAACLGTAAR